MADQQNEKEFSDFEDKTETQLETSKEHSGEGKKGNEKEEKISRRSLRESYRLQNKYPKDGFNKVVGARNDRNRLQKSQRDKQKEPIGLNGLTKKKENKDSKVEKVRMKTSEGSSRGKGDKKHSSSMKRLPKMSRQSQKGNPKELVTIGSQDKWEELAKRYQSENNTLKSSMKQLKEEYNNLKKRFDEFTNLVNENKSQQNLLKHKDDEISKLKGEIALCQEESESKSTVSLTEKTELQRQIIEYKEIEGIKLKEELARFKEELGCRRLVVSLTDLPKPEPPKEGTPHKSNPARHRRLKTTPPRFFYLGNGQTKDLSSIRKITTDLPIFNLFHGLTAEMVRMPTLALENGAAAFSLVKTSEIPHEST